MTWRTLVPLASLAVVGLAGCIVESHPQRGDLTLSWTFTGEDCVSAGIATVNVQLFDAAGNGVANDTFACSQGGASYAALPIGTYGFDLNGFSPGGTRLYEASGNVDVHGGSDTYAIDLGIPP